MLQILSTLASNNAPLLLASAALLLCSATFSGCETALFSLTIPEVNRLRASSARLDRIVIQLHSSLKSLLPTILFCNMAVNVMLYAIAAVIASRLAGVLGVGVAFAYSLASLVVVVFCGEVFPKQFAIKASRTVARLASPPVWLVYRAAARPMRLLGAIVLAAERVFDNRRPEEIRGLREEELRLLVEMSRLDGDISNDEYELIDGVVELPEVRLRDIMVPRVDVPALPAESTPARAIAAARRQGRCKLPVRDAGGDDFAGWVDARDIYAAGEGKEEKKEKAGRGKASRTGAEDANANAPAPEDAGELAAFLRPFRFFSEHDRADQALESLKAGGEGLFAVVDERGAVAGFFTLQDIMDEILGRFGEDGSAPAAEIRVEMEGRYIISGGLSVREWRDIFNVSRDVPKSATVGGLVASLLGRLPKPGDRVALENMEMTVLSTRRNRVREVELRLVGDGAGAKEKRLSARFIRQQPNGIGSKQEKP